MTEARVAAPARLDNALLVVVRVGAAVLWIGSVGWKVPPHFGAGAPADAPRDLYQWTEFAVTDPVFSPYSWLVEHLVLPNFAAFGWTVLLVESALGAFLLIGLATRLWALVGIAQSTAIMLSVANAPHEWIWSYLLMILVHVAIFATAAGRTAGLDGVLRPTWRASRSRLARLLVVVS
jgi:thiosulfate dehydrogenase [quinone] large subunit